MDHRQSKPPGPEPHAQGQADFFRWALNHPKDQFLFPPQNPGVIDRAVDILRQQFMAAPVFRFDERASAAVGRMSIEGLPALGRLAPDIRAPFPAFILELQGPMCHAAAMVSRDRVFGSDAAGQQPTDEDTALTWTYLVRQRQPDIPTITVQPLFAIDLDLGLKDELGQPLPSRGRVRLFLCPWRYVIDPEGRAAVEGPSYQSRAGAAVGAYFAGTVMAGVANRTPGAERMKEVAELIRVEMFARYGIKERSLLPGDDPGLALADPLATMHLLGSGLGGDLTTKAHAKHRTCAYELLKHLSYESPPWGWEWEPTKSYPALYRTLLGETLGEARIVMAALMMLNLRDQVVSVPPPARPSGHQTRKGRSAPYLAASTVTLILPEPIILQRVDKIARAAERIRRRRHEVRGHWCQSRKKGTACIGHVWEALEPDRHHCLVCGAKRWFRKAHARGDASLGYVQRPGFEVTMAEGRS